MKTQPNFQNRDVISISQFDRDDILYLCEKGKERSECEISVGRHWEQFKQKRTLASMFYEPSTRTKTSFDTAMRELDGDVMGFAGTEGTSIMKKESIRDTVKMYEANHADVVAMRHPKDGAVQWAADVASIPVINGGDGKNEHPTQSLLDMLTLYLFNDGKLDGINIGFGGDLAYGRTIRSLGVALSHFDDVTIRWAAEDFLGMPDDLVKILESRDVKVIRERSVKDVMKGSDFYYMTRPQLERMEASKEEIMKMMEKYRIDLAKAKGFEGKLLHPLPVNSEIAEITYDVYFTPSQGFFKQAENGVLIRKALLYEMLKHEGYTNFSPELNPELRYGNNKLLRQYDGNTKKSKKQTVKSIDKGIVIDHLVKGMAEDISGKLDLKSRGSSFPGTDEKKSTSFLKTHLMNLTERDLKNVALMSPDPTISYISGGKVTEKFVYLLCKNDDCVTRVVIEDVPPKFYDDEETMRCRYCRRPYDITNHKVTAEEKMEFMKGLPKKVEGISS